MRTLFYVLTTVVLFQCGQPVYEEPQGKQLPPNLLFILIDDQRNDALSVAGHPIIQTPNVDQLAEDGLRFTNAYVTTPICAASRASILTGLYEYTHNYTFGKPPIQMVHSTHAYPYLLRQAGYRTGFVGKFGVSLADQDSILKDMFDYHSFSPVNTPYFVKLPDGSRRHSAEVKGDSAIAFLQRQSAEQPFCLSLSFNAVHAVDGNRTPGNEGHYPYPAAVAHLYEGISIPEPLLSDPQIFEKHPDFLKNSLNRERYFWRWDTPEKYQTNMRAYYRMISGYDQVIKRVREALKEKGLDKNTIIIFSADNGYYMGDRGFAGKWSHYDESLRVPLIIYDPRLAQKEKYRTTDAIALNIDIPATLLDYAGLPVPESYQGRSLLPLVNKEAPENWREDFIHEHRMGHPQIPKYVGIHGQRYVYANYYEQDPPYEFLHDLETDPDQLINLADSLEYQEIRQTMRSKSRNLIQ
ncbi:MAG TPA: sulfatase [Saprospiraceae bacterium]|nr:sulfatase [Saprospiraceae bacterium]